MVYYLLFLFIVIFILYLLYYYIFFYILFFTMDCCILLLLYVILCSFISFLTLVLTNFPSIFILFIFFIFKSPQTKIALWFLEISRTLWFKQRTEIEISCTPEASEVVVREEERVLIVSLETGGNCPRVQSLTSTLFSLTDYLTF